MFRQLPFQLFCVRQFYLVSPAPDILEARVPAVDVDASVALFLPNHAFGILVACFADPAGSMRRRSGTIKRSRWIVADIGVPSLQVEAHDLRRLPSHDVTLLCLNRECTPHFRTQTQEPTSFFSYIGCVRTDSLRVFHTNRLLTPSRFSLVALDSPRSKAKMG